MVQSQGARKHVDAALCEALGEDYLDHLKRTYTDLDLSTPVRQLAMPFRMNDDDVEVIKDRAYHGDHGRRGLLDIYRPRQSPREDAPVLLQVHGGGWTIGNQGIDVKRAIAWIRENIAEYGADPAFLAVTGGSAGGHLMALAALTPNDPEYQPAWRTSTPPCRPRSRSTVSTTSPPRIDRQRPRGARRRRSSRPGRDRHDRPGLTDVRAAVPAGWARWGHPDPRVRAPGRARGPGLAR